MTIMIRALYLFLVLLGLCACVHKPYPQSLITADSLAGANPDSAVTLLKSIEYTMPAEPEAVQMYYRLLCIKANDKAYMLHTSDSLILPVLHYYIEKDDERHLPEAYYYAGRVYRDLGDAPQALEYFEKAAKALPEDGGYKLKSKIYSQVGTLFSYQSMYTEALEMYKKGKECDNILKDSVGMVFKSRDIGNMYRELGRRDSTLAYFNEANQLSRQLQRPDLFNMMQGQLASLYTDLQEYDSARTVLQNTLRDIEYPSKSAIYSIAARLYDVTNQIDSATYYYQELLNFGTVYAKKAAHQGLAKIALAYGNLQEAALHLSLYEHYIDSINQITDTENIRRLNSLYNYQMREEENKQLKMENERKQAAVVCILLIAILAVSTIIPIYTQYSKKKKAEYQMQIDRLKRLKGELYQRSAQFIEENKLKIEELEKRLSKASQENSSLKSLLQRQKEIIFNTNKQAEIEWNEQEKAKAAFLKSDIYKLFSTLAHPDTQKEERNDAPPPKKAKDQLAQDWILLEQGINSVYKNFSENLKRLHKFNEHEWHVCLLIKIGIQPVDMAVITRHSAESITATRRRLYEKVFLQKGDPKKWDAFILSL